MPRVKIDYIVSFSSEDPDNQASNLLAWEVSKKKWLCGKGEPSCSVVLQLTRAVKISAVHIGAHHAAFVEMLVGRSETPNEDFQVLVPKSVFLSPSESRRGAPVERVRSFTGDQLLAPARAQRWDRARLVCSQPHTKHSQYGLSFVQIYSAEEGAAPPATQPALDTLSSDEEDFKPGELFAKHLQKPTTDQQSNNDTGLQIRQATSHALKNIADSATKLMKTPIAKTTSKHQSYADKRVEDRTRDSLLYTDDDHRPNTKIDHVAQRHNNQKKKEESNKSLDKKINLNDSVNNYKGDKKDSRKESNNVDLPKVDKMHSNNDSNRIIVTNSKNTPISVRNEHRKQKHDHDGSRGAHSSNTDIATNQRDDNENGKRRYTSCEREEAASSEPHTLLRGVVLVLSGYQNPRRAALRSTALALGARVQRDWGAGCTHLICAFPNTPKLRQVRGAAGGGGVPAARGEWLERCAAARRRLPWRWFATEPQAARSPDHPDRRLADADTDCDTDEEIEKVLRNQKKRRTDVSPRRSRDESPDPPSPRHAAERNRGSPESKINSGVTGTHGDSASRRSRYSIDTIIIDPDTVADVVTTNDSMERPGTGELPNFFDGYTFVIDAQAIDERFDVQLLNRYIRAYGGVVLEPSQLDKDSEVNYVVCTGSSAVRAAAAVRPGWVWGCHDARALLPTKEFALL